VTERRLRFLNELSDVSELPSEFRIFKAGENPSTKGSVWFDARSAKLVMGQARAHDVDHIIDLEHRSIRDQENGAPLDTDARGYYRPKMKGQDLWATGVSWTDDGAERLRSRRQRYTSPAFWTEWDRRLNGGQGGERVTELINVALCSMPATHGCEALVRSRLDARSGGGYAPSVPMTEREAIEAALAALAAGDMAGAQAALAACAPSGDAPAEALAEDPGPPPPPEGEQPPAPEARADEPAEEEEKKDEEVSEFSRKVEALGGLELFTQLVAERDAAQAAERSALVTGLVEIGAETPATAFSAGKLATRLASEPLAELRSRVAALRAARPAGAPAHVAPPVQPDADGLSEVERQTAAGIKNPEARARFIALRTARRAGK
jgi:hypothetical protein